MHIPNTMPYFCAWGISSKPNVARTSSKEDIDRMDERDCLIFSRSERLLLGATIALCCGCWLLCWWSVGGLCFRAGAGARGRLTTTSCQQLNRK